MTSVIKTRQTGEAPFLIGSSSSLSHPLPRIMADPQQSSAQTAGNPMGQSIPVNLTQAVAPVPDTSSQALGLEDEGDKSPETSTSSIRRVVEKTVDRLGRSRSSSNKSPSKRIFSLGRNRGKEPGPFGAILIHPHPSPLVLTSRRLQRTQRHRPRLETVTHLMTPPLSTRLLPPPLYARR